MELPEEALEALGDCRTNLLFSASKTNELSEVPILATDQRSEAAVESS